VAEDPEAQGADESESISSGERDHTAVVLLEITRQRLITLASGVLGRLPADEVPSSLRAMARFTPAKRVRLGASVLSAALDADAAFRDRVGEVVAEASAQLAEAVRSGASTAASDPVDTAAVAYLLRPAGWQQIIADANTRLSAERTHLGRTEQSAELEQARAELAELKSRARADTARVKAALASASEQSGVELAETRRQLRARSTEVQAAERARDEAQQRAAAAEQQAQAAETTREAEARRSKARISELERAVETGRRSARLDRDIDEARLWLLTETLTDAAAGIRRELSLSAALLRPADTVGGGADGAGVHVAHIAVAHIAYDAATLDRLLALPHAHLIVDGYNVTKTGYGELPLADQRRRLVTGLAGLSGRSGAETTIAFDGGVRPPAQPATPRGVRVLFSGPDEIADDLIRRLIAAEPAGRVLVVVSTDQQIAMDARGAGAWSVPSAVLLARLDQL
jgi:predicted RNA-binding protein with PIN domain